MTTRFAGSSDLAQRRRRRLAQEAMGEGSPASSRSVRNATAAFANASAPLNYSGPRLPERTLVPGRWRTIGILTGLGILIWGIILWLSGSPLSAQLGIAEITTLEGGALPHYFSTVALLATAQLTLLIYWHRSRSRKDFVGRYRIWGWAGLFWCLVCLAQSLQWHLPILDWLNARCEIDCWRGHQLFWFIPLSIGTISIYHLVGREVNPSVHSSIAWNFSFGVGFMLALLYFGMDLLFPYHWRAAILVAVTMFWHLTLAVFTLIHARYVTHVNNEVGIKRVTTRSKLSRRGKSELRRLGEAILKVPVQLRRKTPAFRWPIPKALAKLSTKNPAPKKSPRSKSRPDKDSAAGTAGTTASSSARFFAERLKSFIGRPGKRPKAEPGVSNEADSQVTTSRKSPARKQAASAGKEKQEEASTQNRNPSWMQRIKRGRASQQTAP